jgi:hypothetical protein
MLYYLSYSIHLAKYLPFCYSCADVVAVYLDKSVEDLQGILNISSNEMPKSVIATGAAVCLLTAWGACKEIISIFSIRSEGASSSNPTPSPN